MNKKLNALRHNNKQKKKREEKSEEEIGRKLAERKEARIFLLNAIYCTVYQSVDET